MPKVLSKMILLLDDIVWFVLLTFSGSFVANKRDISSCSFERKLITNELFFKKSTWSVSDL